MFSVNSLHGAIKEHWHQVLVSESKDIPTINANRNTMRRSCFCNSPSRVWSTEGAMRLHRLLFEYILLWQCNRVMAVEAVSLGINIGQRILRYSVSCIIHTCTRAPFNFPFGSVYVPTLEVTLIYLPSGGVLPALILSFRRAHPTAYLRDNSIIMTFIALCRSGDIPVYPATNRHDYYCGAPVLQTPTKIQSHWR